MKTESPTISRTWAVVCAIACIVIAIAFDRFILSGHAKAVGFVVFMSAFCLKVSWPLRKNPSVIFLLLAFASFHILIAFVLPRDAVYPGAFLIPLAFLDFFAFYFLLKRIMRVPD